ncbi:hypothetical protein [Luteolibacter sp. AS25]|uniref:hypothetical protein n=1 Tax=Luteolibacter sp. AS25 TaxID=3135776 RepID=UPI00398B5D77
MKFESNLPPVVGSQRSTALLRDLAAAFTQQMFFWGMDASVSSGNLFQKSGFQKSPSLGLKGTSCYSLPWQGGSIFLHGSCVGWLPGAGSPGLMFIRNTGKCFLWQGLEPPIPGKWPKELISSVDLFEDILVLTPFLEWWLEHEAWVSAEMGSAYRTNCYRSYKSLSKSKPWLTPENSVAWLHLLLENPGKVSRAKNFSRQVSA